MSLISQLGGWELLTNARFDSADYHWEISAGFLFWFLFDLIVKIPEITLAFSHLYHLFGILLVFHSFLHIKLTTHVLLSRLDGIEDSSYLPTRHPTRSIDPSPKRSNELLIYIMRIM